MGRVLMEEGEAREYSCVKEAQGWGNPAQVQRRAFEVRGWVRTFREQVTDAEWWGRSLDIKVDKLWSLTVRNCLLANRLHVRCGSTVAASAAKSLQSCLTL